jgi:Flp pilus assembly protein TadG
MRTGPGPVRAVSARGAVLVEFALVSLAFYLLIAGIVTFGTMIHTAQVAQDAARIAARDLALIPLPSNSTFDQALADARVKTSVYDPDLLVVDLDNIPGGVSLDTYVASMPDVNRALRPAMIYDEVATGGGTRRLLRMPGALIVSSTAPSGLSVAVPLVVARDNLGRETIEWVPVLEEVRTNRTDPATGSFSVASTSPIVGVVAVRINIPSQSAAMGAFQNGASHLDPNLSNPIVADDSAVSSINAAPGILVGAKSTTGFHANDGPYGLGHVEALGKTQRPFRRVLTAQAFFRREVFAEQSQP